MTCDRRHHRTLSMQIWRSSTRVVRLEGASSQLDDRKFAQEAERRYLVSESDELARSLKIRETLGWAGRSQQ
jgi:hypothetical protein